MSKYFFILFLFAICFHVNLSAQDTKSNSTTYDKDGLKFEYPSGWTLTDKSSSEIQTFYLTKEKNTVLIVVTSPREILGQQRQYENLQRDSNSKYRAAISKSFSTPDKAAEMKSVCLDINDTRKIYGARFTGIYNNEPGTGDVYSFALGNRLLTVAYLKNDKESQFADVVWESLVKSLYTKDLEKHNKEETASFSSGLMNGGGVMNGRALKLVKPAYPSAASKLRLSDEVQVKVIIDEAGKVISAKAVSGDRVFYGEAEIAAKASKFRPTIVCDKPVKVNGIIVYNFVP